MRVALDITAARLGRAGPSVYTTQLAQQLATLMGERLVPVASRLAVPPHPRRTVADLLRTLGRDLWWHQFGVSFAARGARADLLHLPAAVGPVAAFLPMVVTIHDVIVLRFPELFRPWHRHYARAVLPRLVSSAAAVITVSEAARADVVEYLDLAPERVAVVPNGVDPLFHTIDRNGEAARSVVARYRLPPDFVLTVGAIEPRKNLPRILDALRQLRDRGPTAGITLVHAGPEGWLADDVSRGAARFLGYVPAADLRVLYNLARALVYPSLWEGFGLPVIEAMACGCPVVTSTVSALPDVAGGAAVLVNPESVEDIAAAIERLWLDDAWRRKYATAGLARARCFTWERCARETLAVYEQALR